MNRPFQTRVARSLSAFFPVALGLAALFTVSLPQVSQAASPTRYLPNSGRGAMPPLVVQLSQNTLQLDDPDETGLCLSTRSVGIRAANAQPGWRIVCRAEDAQGPDGAILSASDISILVQRKMRGYTVTPIPADKPVVLVQGNTLTGPLLQEVGAFAVQVQTRFDTPPGVYTALLRVYADSAGGRRRISANGPGCVGEAPVQNLVVTFCVPETFRILVSDEALNFGSVQPTAAGGGPALFTSLNTPRVVIETNQRHLETQVVMDALRLEGTADALIAGKRTALVWGRTPAEAFQKARAVSIGQNQFSVPLDRAGRYTFYLAGKVALSMADKPGNYQGQATITANGR
jgi:hypothetical protein